MLSTQELEQFRGLSSAAVVPENTAGSLEEKRSPRMSTRLKTVVAAAAAFLLSVPALAETYTVPTSKYPTIQAGLDACNVNGDEVVVNPGIYFETNLDFQGKSILLRSSSGNTVTIIDGQGSGTLLRFVNGENDEAIVEGFTIRNADLAIEISDSSPTIQDCKIINCGATNGSNRGGIRCTGTFFVQVFDCEFKNNSSDTQGAAIYGQQSGDGSQISVSNTLFFANDSDSGGAIYTTGGVSLGIDNCIFLDNKCVGNHNGGAIHIGGGTASIATTQFDANYINAGGSGDYPKGGAIYLSNADATISQCSFNGNFIYGNSNHYGGAVYATDSSLNMLFCDFDGNVVAQNHSSAVSGNYWGGALFLRSTYGTIDRCNFRDNSSRNFDSDYRGGAVFLEDYSGPLFLDCIFQNNSSWEGGAIYCQSQSTPVFFNCQFSTNSAKYGGVAYTFGTPVFNSCSLADNLASQNGGAIKSVGSGGSIPTISDSLLCGNGIDNSDPFVVDHINGTWFDDGNNTFADSCGDDCNENNLPDLYDLLLGISLDCNGNGIPDECDIEDGTESDCDANGIPDSCDIADGLYADCDGNGVPDQCDEDCNGNGIPDACDLADGTAPDCNGNGIPDSCDIAAETSVDCDGNGIPDECEPDCNSNGITDACDIADGTSTDCNANGIPDECDFIDDCNDNGVSDACDIANGDSSDNNGNGVPDECECPADLNGDTFVNVNDLLALIGAWGQSGPEDLNGDGNVGVDDLLALISVWGPCPN
tara:strand:+ start:2430 stop:4712 length:2283 start_codon:yes stop_codon:yes gene_type:complete